MTRVSDGQLVKMALSALEDAVARAHAGPVERTWGLKLALAYLASRRQCERWPFDTFWAQMGEASANERWTSLNAALNGIYKQLQIRKEMPVNSSFERDARKRLGRKGPEERAERNWGGDKGRG